MSFDPTQLSNIFLILTAWSGAFLAAFWLSLVIWTFRDIRSRARDPMARILILAPQTPVPPAALTGAVQGTTIRNYNLLAGLARRHTVDLVTFLAPGTGEDAVDLLRPASREIVALPQGVRTLADRARDTVLSGLPSMAVRMNW